MALLSYAVSSKFQRDYSKLRRLSDAMEKKTILGEDYNCK